MPSIEQNRQKLLGGIQDGSLTPASEIREVTPPPAVPPADSKTERATPFLRAPVPSTFQLGQDSFQAFQKNNLPGNRIAPLPPSLNTGIGANAKTQIIVQQQVGSGQLIEVNNLKTASQTILNFIGTGITSDAFGGIHFPSSTGDGLTHSSAPWESDPAYVVLREDFYGMNVSGKNAVLAINTSVANGWFIIGSVGSTSGATGGIPPYIGQIWWANAGTSSAVGALMYNIFQSSNTGTVSGGASNYYGDGALALFDNPGWQLSWVFKIDNPRQTATPFSLTQQATYVGLVGSNATSGFSGASPLVSRPDVFFGARYDTSAALGPFVLTAAGNASAGVTTYTGTITGGASAQPFVGRLFTVTGFGTAANNGTWDCTAAGATTITLRNPAGVAETHAGSVTSGGIADTVFVLEAVQNPSYALTARNNTQGTTQSTGITPTIGVWYRVDIVCSVAGSVKITLSGGGQTSTMTTSVSTMSVTAATNWLTGNAATNNYGRLTYTPGNPAIAPTAHPFSSGSQITVSGFSGTQAPLNGTFTLQENLGVPGTGLYYNIAHASFGAAAVAGTITGYPAVYPCLVFGQDDSASPTNQVRNVYVDFFSLVWNPNLGPSAPGTPDSTKARYW